MSVSRDSIIRELYISRGITEAINKIEPASLRDDLKQEVFWVLCEMPPEKFYQLHSSGTLLYYTIGTMLRMVNSTKSYQPFYKNFRVGKDVLPLEHELQVADAPESYIDVKLVHKAIDLLPWHERELLKLYTDNDCNAAELCRITGINHRSVQHIVRKAILKTRHLYKNLTP